MNSNIGQVEVGKVIAFTPADGIARVKVGHDDVVFAQMKRCRHVDMGSQMPVFTTRPCETKPKLDDEVIFIRKQFPKDEADRWIYINLWEATALSGKASDATPAPTSVVLKTEVASQNLETQTVTTQAEPAPSSTAPEPESIPLPQAETQEGWEKAFNDSLPKTKSIPREERIQQKDSYRNSPRKRDHARYAGSR